MPSHTPKDVARQYASSDPLVVRMRTHQLYGERRVDLDAICYAALDLTGNEAILDAGCGPGRFLNYIRSRDHTSKLVGLDQSAAMVAGVAELGIDAVQGDVQSLPFDNQSFDRVVARHMLYHVPDIPLALSEFRRTLRTDGLLLATTNSATSMPRILELIQDLLAAFDQPDWERPDSRFSIENAVRFFEDAGYAAEARVIENALIFHSPDPIIDYCASCLPSLDIAQDPALHAEMVRWLIVEAGRRLDRLGGEWRDPTYAGLYVCRSL
ncbi:class I SAM-dependent methyltransferase [soil metagenome]